MIYIIDTYAWIEYFKGSPLGKNVKNIIENGGNLVPTIVLAEIKKKFTDWNRDDFDEILHFIHQHATTVPLDEATAILAGEIRSRTSVQGMGLVDCILIALARLYSCKVLTNDEHFEQLPEATFMTEVGIK